MKTLPHLPVRRVEKKWGEEVWLCNNKYYCGKLLNFTKGSKGSLHYHKLKNETFYLLKGKVNIQIKDCTYLLLEGEVIDIPAGVEHRVAAVEDSIIVEFSTTHYDFDTYRIEESS